MKLPRTIRGPVMHGEKVGRTIGFPTANLALTPKPNDLTTGVYFGWCQVADEPQKKYCLAYYGPRLIFGEKVNNFEVFLYDFADEIYGKYLTVHLLEYCRPPVEVLSLADLKVLLEQDVTRGKTLMTKHDIRH